MKNLKNEYLKSIKVELISNYIRLTLCAFFSFALMFHFFILHEIISIYFIILFCVFGIFLLAKPYRSDPEMYISIYFYLAPLAITFLLVFFMRIQQLYFLHYFPYCWQPIFFQI